MKTSPFKVSRVSLSIHFRYLPVWITSLHSKLKGTEPPRVSCRCFSRCEPQIFGVIYTYLSRIATSNWVPSSEIWLVPCPVETGSCGIVYCKVGSNLNSTCNLTPEALHSTMWWLKIICVPWASRVFIKGDTDNQAFIATHILPLGQVCSISYHVRILQY